MEGLVLVGILALFIGGISGFTTSEPVGVLRSLGGGTVVLAYSCPMKRRAFPYYI